MKNLRVMLVCAVIGLFMVGTAMSMNLHNAARAGDLWMVNQLLLAGADVNAVDGDGNTPLHVAAVWDREGIVRQLLAEGAEIDAKDKYGNMPLHWAAMAGHKGIMNALLDQFDQSETLGRKYGSLEFLLFYVKNKYGQNVMDLMVARHPALDKILLPRVRP